MHWHGISAVAVNADSFCVAPAMDHALENVRIGSGQHRCQRISFNRLATAGKIRRCDLFAGMLDDVRQLENSASHARMLLEYRKEQGSIASAHIHDPSEVLKRIV